MKLKTKNNLKRNLLITQVSIYLFIILHSISWHVFGLHWITKLCPANFAERLGSLEFNFTVLFWFLVFISTLFVGRAFCAWGCMFGAYQDFVSRVYTKLKIKPIKNKVGLWLLGILLSIFTIPVILVNEIAWPTYFWFIVLVVLIGLIVWFFVEKDLKIKNLFKLPKYIQVVNYLGGIVSLWIILNIFQKGFSFAFEKYGILDEYKTARGIIFASLTLSLTAIGILVEKRFFCKYLCPYGLLVRFISSIPFSKRYKIRATDTKCTECTKCNKECLMDIKPMEEIVKYKEIKNPECINCLQCIASCPKGVIKFTNKPQYITKPIKQ
jgi:polyferredoxin